MFGAFFSYMGNDAKSGCNLKGNRLSESTADGYCSSARGFFENKFRAETPIPVFQPMQWKKLRGKLKGLYREHKRAIGKPTRTIVATASHDKFIYLDRKHLTRLRKSLNY